MRSSFITFAPAMLATITIATVVACANDSAAAPAGPYNDVLTLANNNSRQYGEPVALGNGSARTYVVFDEKQKGRAIELGVALTPDALEGLPAPMNMPPGNNGGHEHVDSHEYILQMPQQNGTPFKFLKSIQHYDPVILFFAHSKN